MTYDITDKLQHYFAGTNTPNINDLLLSQDNINLTLAIMQVHASCCPFTQSLLFNFTVLIKKIASKQKCNFTTIPYLSSKALPNKPQYSGCCSNVSSCSGTACLLKVCTLHREHLQCSKKKTCKGLV